jgi:hypothetical protein
MPDRPRTAQYSGRALAIFIARAIRPEVAMQAGVREVIGIDAGNLVGRHDGASGRYDGLAIPNIFSWIGAHPPRTPSSQYARL